DVRLPRPGRAWATISDLSTATHYGPKVFEHLDDITPVPGAGLGSLLDTSAESILVSLRRRDEVLAGMPAAFAEVDFLITPTTASTAFMAEGPPPMEIAGQKVGGMGSVPYTAPFNISGMPAVASRAGCRRRGCRSACKS